MTVEIVPYTPEWPRLFEVESMRIHQALGDHCIRIHHIGSTAVPGLWAKPVIDIIVVVKEGMRVTQELEKAGYLYKGEYNIPFHSFFSKPEGSIHLHVFEDGNPEINLNLLFRDYLRTSSETRTEYTDLKKHLVAEKSSHKKINSRFKGYTLGKDAFIRKVLKQAGFERLCIRFCTHHAEWAAYHRIRKEQVFDLLMRNTVYVAQWDRVNTLAFRRILEYFVGFSMVLPIEIETMNHTMARNI